MFRSNLGLELRRPNAAYYAAIDAYWDWLIPLLAPLQYSAGGPIIDFQIEDDTDVPLIPIDDTHAYYGWLRDGLRNRGITSLISTLAWPVDLSILKATIPGTWT